MIELTLTHLFEIYIFTFDGVEYEVKVDSMDGVRGIEEMHNLSLGDEISDEVYDFVHQEIKKIDNI